MIKNALSVIPARPVMFIAPALVVLVLSLYYWDMYSRCSDNKQFRASFNELLRTRDSGSQFRLTEITKFMWDRVRIVTNFEPESSSNECPLGWNWPDGERESLISAGLLTALIFVDKGTIVQYLELRSDEVEFRGADFSIAPNAATFDIAQGSGNSTGVTLVWKQ